MLVRCSFTPTQPHWPISQIAFIDQKQNLNDPKGFLNVASAFFLIFIQFHLYFLFCSMHFLPIFAIIFLGTIQFANGDVLCTGLPNGGRLYCSVACCISQDGNRQTYHCCGSMVDNGPGWVYREKSTSAEERPSRYVSYNTVRIDWWNSLLISLAVSIILSIILSLLCCFFCSRRRR